MTPPDGAVPFGRAAAVLASARRVLLTSHARPDGDAIGALTATASMLRRRGVDATAVLADPVPRRYAWLSGAAFIGRWPQEIGPHNVGAVDAVVVLDTSSRSQLEAVWDYLSGTEAPVIVVDHHAVGDTLGTIRLIEPTAAATCQILARWFEATGWGLTRPEAEALFAGLATDTGWFRFPSVDATVLQQAGRLVAAGAQPAGVYEALYLRDSAARVRLFAEVIREMELRADGRLAVLTVTQQTLRACGAEAADTEDLVNEPLRIERVVASVLVSDLPDGRSRASLRSQRDVDVAAIAASLGGGGHHRAAGTTAAEPLDSLKRRVTDAVERALGQSCPGE